MDVTASVTVTYRMSR